MTDRRLIEIFGALGGLVVLSLSAGDMMTARYVAAGHVLFLSGVAVWLSRKERDHHAPPR